jgi:hypothetical protein
MNALPRGFVNYLLHVVRIPGGAAGVVVSKQKS